jgi:hypothetical protein
MGGDTSRSAVTWCERVNGLFDKRRIKNPGGEVANPHAGFLNINLVSPFDSCFDKLSTSSGSNFRQIKTPHITVLHFRPQRGRLQIS